MFKFLKKKLGDAVNKIKESLKKEAVAEEIEPTEEVELKEVKEERKEVKEKEKEIKEEEKEEKKEERKKETEIKETKYKKTEEQYGVEAQYDVYKKTEEHGKKIKPIIVEVREKPKSVKKEKSKIKPEVISEKERPEELKSEEIKLEEIKKGEGGPEIKYEEIENAIDKASKEKGFFERLKEKVTKTRISDEKFDVLFQELEFALLENNVAVEVVEKIKEDLKRVLVDQPISRGKVEQTILSTLRESLYDLFDFDVPDLLKKVKEKKPFVIVFFGVNGSGKTTSIAKIANYLKKNKISCVIAAGDTFRAAAIDQLQEHADKLDVKLIKHNYGADPAAVAFDSIKYAEANGIDCVLIDTAGRLHSNVNLMEQMEKIVRVSKPQMKIFIGEATTGNDCVEQAKQFNNKIGIDGVIITKADVDEKGGAFISINYITGSPIIMIGTGQNYDDIKPFSKDMVLNQLGI